MFIVTVLWEDGHLFISKEMDLDICRSFASESSKDAALFLDIETVNICYPDGRIFEKVYKKYN